MPRDYTGRDYDTMPTRDDLLGGTRTTSDSSSLNAELEKLFKELQERMARTDRNFSDTVDAINRLTQEIKKQNERNRRSATPRDRTPEARRAGTPEARRAGTPDAFPDLIIEEARAGRGRARGGARGGAGGGARGGIFDFASRWASSTEKNAKAAIKSLSEVFSPPKELQFKTIEQLKSPIEHMREAQEFGVLMKRAVYQTTGLGNEARDTLDSFLEINENMKVQERTGFHIMFAQKQMLKYVQSGIKMDKDLVKSKEKMQKVAIAQLNTERQLGLQAGTLDEHFIDVVNQAKMSNSQINLMSKNMRDVANNTGLTGQKMAEAIAASKQFNNNLLNAGNLTATSMKNVISLTANFKKSGVEQAGGELLNYLTDANKLFMGANDPMANIVRQAAALGGVTQELQDGVITKSEQANRAFAKGFTEYRKMISGVENEEAFEAMSDAEKAIINRRVAAATQGTQTIGTIFRMEKAQLRATMTFTEKIADLNKEIGKNKANIHTKEGKMLEKQLQAEARVLKQSKAMDVLGALGEEAEKGGGKTVGDVLKRFEGPEGIMEKRGFTKDIATMFGKTEEEIRKAGVNKTLKNEIVGLAEELDVKMKKENMKGLDPTVKAQIDKAFNAGASKDEINKLVEMLQEAEQALSVQKQENLDPTTKALHNIQKNVEIITKMIVKNFLLKTAAPGGAFDKAADDFSNLMTNLIVEGSVPGFIDPVQGIRDRAKFLSPIIGNDLAESLKNDKLPPELQDILKSGGAIAELFKMIVPTRSIGTNMVTKEGLTYLHKGEMIVPEKYANASEDTGAFSLNQLVRNNKTNFQPRNSSLRKTLEYNKDDMDFDQMYGGIKTLEYNKKDMEFDRMYGGIKTLEYNKKDMEFDKNYFEEVMALITRNRDFQKSVDDYVPSIPPSSSLFPMIKESFPAYENNELSPENRRIQTQISSFNSNAGKISLIEEKNSSRIVSVLIEIKEEIKKQNIVSSNSSSTPSSDFILNKFKNKMAVDPRLGVMKGGDYTKNDSIKAMNY